MRNTPYQLAVFWPNFWTRNSRNLIKGSKNAYSCIESKNTASQNIGAWDWTMTSYNSPKTCPCHDPIGPKPPNQIKNFYFFNLNYATPPAIYGHKRAGQSQPLRVNAENNKKHWIKGIKNKNIYRIFIKKVVHWQRVVKKMQTKSILICL